MFLVLGRVEFSVTPEFSRLRTGVIFRLIFGVPFLAVGGALKECGRETNADSGGPSDFWGRHDRVASHEVSRTFILNRNIKGSNLYRRY